MANDIVVIMPRVLLDFPLYGATLVDVGYYLVFFIDCIVWVLVIFFNAKIHYSSCIFHCFVFSKTTNNLGLFVKRSVLFV